MRNLRIERNKKRPVKEEINPSVYLAYFAIPCIILIGFGLSMLYSASYDMVGDTYFFKQCIWVGVGIVGILFIVSIGYIKLAEYSSIFIFISVILLIIAFFSTPINGACRWIKTPFGNIQPSEYAKLAVLLYMSSYCTKNVRFLNKLFDKRGLLPVSAVLGLIMALIFMGKDLGTTALLGGAGVIVLFIAGVNWKTLAVTVSVLLCSAAYYVCYVDLERLSRITSFINPEKLQFDDGYQLWFSILALGSGGWFGLGLGDSRLKIDYLPERHTDFILSIVGEELGFIIIFFIIITYICFAFFAIKLSFLSKNKLGSLLGLGISFMLMLQTFINLGVVSGSLPTKGMPAPFISYGGSNMIVSLLGIGFIISIALESIKPNYNSIFFGEIKNKLFGKLKIKN